MIERIDEYVKDGGVAVLDATATRCYRIYTGQIEFSIDGQIVANYFGSEAKRFTHKKLRSVFRKIFRQSSGLILSLPKHQT